MCLLIKAFEEKNCHLAFTWAERLELNSKADQTFICVDHGVSKHPFDGGCYSAQRWKDSRKKIIVSIF